MTFRELHDLDSHTYRAGRHEKRGRHEHQPTGVLERVRLETWVDITGEVRQPPRNTDYAGNQTEEK